jgi:hypothetical protein
MDAGVIRDITEHGHRDSNPATGPAHRHRLGNQNLRCPPWLMQFVADAKLMRL